MTVRRIFAAVLALCALLIGAACSDRDNTGLPAELDEPLFVQGVQLRKQGRSSEALTSFLKVIEKRGLRESAESHLEAGLIYLNHTKDPIKAIYHFQQYLELQPNSKQSLGVRGMVDAARREYAKTLMLGANLDDATRVPLHDEAEKLRRENMELRAEIQVLRGGGAALASRTARLITLPEGLTSPATTPPPITPQVDPSQANAAANVSRTAASPTTIAVPLPGRTPPAARPTGSTTPTRPVATQGKTYIVQPKESLYSIAKRHNLKTEDLARANGIRDPNKVPAGTVLRIP